MTARAARNLWLHLLERGAAGINPLINSLLVAHLLGDVQAASYFFGATAAQLTLGLWLPAADSWWQGPARRRMAPASAHPALLAFVSVATGLSALAWLAGAGWFAATRGADLLLLGWCLLGNVGYAAVMVLLPAKYGQPARYVTPMVIGALVAAALKLLVLLWPVAAPAARLVLFADGLLVGVAALLAGMRLGSLRVAPLRLAGPGAAQIRQMAGQFAGPLLLVGSTLLAWKLVMLQASLVLAAADYTVFGLALQMLNMVTVLTSALSTSLATLLVRQAGRPDRYRNLLAFAARAALGVFGCYAGGLLLVGQPLLAWLLGPRGALVYPLVVDGLPYVAAVLLMAVALVVAAAKERTGAQALGMLVTALVSAIGFQWAGGLVSHMQAWAVCQLLCAMVLLGMVVRMPEPASGLSAAANGSRRTGTE